MTTEQIVDRLNLLKKQQGLTLKQLADKSGLTPGTVNKIMSGALQKIKKDKLEALAVALGVTTQWLKEDMPLDNESQSNSFGLVPVACISPEVKVCDVDYNCDRIIEQAQRAHAKGIKLALFPELCVTGYSCDDLFFQHTLRKAAQDGLRKICAKLAPLDIVVVVGLPLNDDRGNLYNVAAIVYHGEVLGVVPKTNLPNYNEFYEKRVFAPGFEGNTTVNLFGKDVPFGTKLIFANTSCEEMRFAVEICEDVWVSDCPSNKHSEAGANIILNLSASDETVCKAEFRRKMIEIQSGKTCTAYLYTSAGPSESTSSTVFSAHNLICENGELIAESLPFAGGYAQAEIDVDFIANERSRLKQPLTEGYQVIKFSLKVNAKPTRMYSPTPFTPADKAELATRCDRAFTMLAYGLKKRIEHSGVSKLVIGVSGGTDSSLALITCVNALKLLNRPASDIVAVTMPCFGTTERTLNNSVALAQALGATVRKIDISKAVTQHFDDIGQSILNTDTTYENAQARERTQVLMDIANQLNGLVVGTGDMSELALGWATFNGDQMSMYGVNCSVPKTLVKAMLARKASLSDDETKRVINDVLNTPVSPELLPADDGKITQITENAVGPYVLHDYFLFMTVRKGFCPSKIFELAQISFEGSFDRDTIYKWLRKFIWRFFSQQFKRSCTPDGVRIGSVDLSKYGHRMPSDASPQSWIADLDKAYNK